jgi:hypothetical protein
METYGVGDIAPALTGVRRINADGLAQWRDHGRLVACELDDAHVVIRSGFRIPRLGTAAVSRAPSAFPPGTPST